MTGSHSSKATRLARDTRGGTAMIWALMMLPICVMLGMGLDLQRFETARYDLARSLDAAALMAAKELMPGATAAQRAALEAKAETVFEANIRQKHADVTCTELDATIDMSDLSVTATASCLLPTTFGGLMSVENYNIGGRAKAMSPNRIVDVALMLDVSGSMAGTKLTDLVTASKAAADVLLAPSQTSSFRIAVAPYAGAVNAGAYAASAVDPGDYDATLAEPNCVTERKGVSKWNDDAPGGPNKWVGYDSPGVCPSATILPLTSNAQDVKDHIDTLVADGATAGQIGIAWSWYMVSPNWNGLWPTASDALAYGQTGMEKVVILMTDGEFNTAYDTTAGDSTQQAKALCDGMKLAGIVIYSVAFDAPLAGVDVLDYCASSSDKLYQPTTGTELIAVYEDIAAQLSMLRLSE